MDEGRLRSLEKCFFFFLEEMVRWRKKNKGNKKVNSDEWGSKKKKKKKRERERDMMNRGQHSATTTQSTRPKKKIFSFSFPPLK